MNFSKQNEPACEEHSKNSVGYRNFLKTINYNFKNKKWNYFHFCL